MDHAYLKMRHLEATGHGSQTAKPQVNEDTLLSSDRQLATQTESPAYSENVRLY